ncbi:MAG: DUF87 domain-containing protein [Thermoplasmata archaeon]|nr:MAG: DUF87 domain-containing protein [Thermoplasmata archaeon]
MAEEESLHIGEFDGNPFAISGTQLLTNRTAIIGMSGSGKSHLMGVLCEEMCKANLPFVIIDTEGEYYSLKEKFEIAWASNNKEADAMLSIEKCKLLAERIVKLGGRLIFDTSSSSNEFELVSEFLKHLYEFETEVKIPMLVIVEEADRFVPQSGGAQISELHEISRRGRKRGIGLMVATQRPAMVDKNILSQCGNQFIGRLRIENDVKAVSRFFHKTRMLDELPNLERGEFFVMGESLVSPRLVHVKNRETSHGGAAPKMEKHAKFTVGDLVTDIGPETLEDISDKLQTIIPKKDKPKEIERRKLEVKKVGDTMEGKTPEKEDKIQDAQKASGTDATQKSIMLDHFIWYPIPGKGYQDLPIAISTEGQPSLFTRLFQLPTERGPEFSPILVRYEVEDFKGHLIFNKEHRNQIIISYITHTPVADEYGRTGVFHHSAIVDKKLFKTGGISLLNVLETMEDYDKNNTYPKGKIEKLEVQKKDTPGFDYKGKIKNIISKAAVETLATRLMTSDRYRTIFRCLRSSSEDRMRIAIYLLELLNFECGLRPISMVTERPIPQYNELFDVAVTERAIDLRTNAEDWAVILWDLEHPLSKRIKNRDDVYKKIDEAFS